ncbi:MAG: hypothetical protein IM500_16445 [Microcystis sp. M179S2]|uniref:hypothetical protein n=1 Tax=Microcystis sp. M179S2 TaxID=2771160 RepID=UPI002582A168|nr:hypothetical protein [Microcystis sp. M179S2]MCA2701952.1 hypothetical protein [Microcystis sp. M179S2]
MNEEHITRVTREQWAKLKGKTDWKKVKGMSEAEIAKNALEADRGTSQLKSLCSMEYRHRLPKKISHIYHI